MGVCNSTNQTAVEKEERQKARQIESQLKNDRKEYDSEVKLLLLGMLMAVLSYRFIWTANIKKLLNECRFTLRHSISIVGNKLSKYYYIGAGESGKSTIAKQMKNIYLDGFTADERLQYKEIIYSNIVSSMKTLIEACPKYGCSIEKAAEVIITPLRNLPSNTKPNQRSLSDVTDMKFYRHI